MRKAYPKSHGEKKKQFQFMLTETASAKVDRVAESLNLSRSEVFERLCRDDEKVLSIWIEAI